MKKTLSLILVVIMALMLLPVNAVFADTDTGVDMEDLYTVCFTVESVTVENGTDTVTVDVNVSQNAGIAMMMYRLEFDAEALTLAEEPVLGNVDGFEFLSIGELKEGEHTAMIASTNPAVDVVGDGVLVTYTFNIKPDAPSGAYGIDFVTTGVSDNGVPLGVERYNGYPVLTLNVSGGVIIEGEAPPNPDDPTYVVKYNANGGSGAPLDDTKYHDRTFTISPAVPNRRGYIFVGWATSPDAKTAEYLPGQFYTENSDLTLYAVWTLADPIHMVDISASAKTARRDQTVEITIDIANNLGFTAMEFGIYYDKDVLTPTKTTKGLLADGQCIISQNDGFISVYHANGVANVEGNDTLMTVTFAVKENAELGQSAITIVPGVMTRLVGELGDQYEVDIGANCTAGYVEVVAQMTGDLNLDESVDLEDAILLLQHSLFPDDYVLEYVGSVDFTRNGSVDLEDAILLLQHSLFPDDYPIE